MPKPPSREFDWRAQTNWPFCLVIVAPETDRAPRRAWLEFGTREQAEAHIRKLPPYFDVRIEERGDCTP